MTVRAVDRLTAARKRQFVGRARELELFEEIVRAHELPALLVWVWGPGGVGKSTLLRAYAECCERHEVPAFVLDARNVEPSPEGFLAALRFTMGLEGGASPIKWLEDRPGREVVMIDTYELLTPLDSWLRDVFLPQAPADLLFVFAGRESPGPAWRSDPGWHALLRSVALRNLTPEESRAYLQKRAVPVDQSESVLAFTHGHPLALSLVADLFAQRGDVHFQPEAAPDVIKALLTQLVQKVPGPAHRATLEACALVRLMTEPLLANMLGVQDAQELFDWLRGLSFIDSGPLGLYPHDLTREALVADLRWRNPLWYAELHKRARTYCLDRLQSDQTGVGEHRRILFDLIFLHRDNPAVRPFFEWQESGSVLTDTLRAEDRETIAEIVARHEGPEAGVIAAHWMERQPEGWIVFRDAEQKLAGLLASVALERVSPADVGADPAAAATTAYLKQHAPLRPGERALLFRFWMDRDAYQAVSPIQSLAFILAVQQYLTTPDLAFTFFPVADPNFWSAVLTYGDQNRLPEADYTVGGRTYGAFGHDWRKTPPAAWLNLLAEREVIAAGDTPASRAPERIEVLSQPDFAAAVRDALRDFVRPDLLAGNPLIRARLVRSKAGDAASAPARAAALQALVREAVEMLQVSPRDAKLYRALYHTYIQPAPTQERAAELLDVPFSTYRRHLVSGISQVTEILWQRETAAS